MRCRIHSLYREWVSGNTSPRTLTTNVSVSCGEEKRVCHLLVHLGTQTSTTRTLGDLLTFLCLFLINIILHTLIHKYQSYDTFQDGSGADPLSALKESKIHGHTCQETLENDIHVFLDGMEKPTHIFRMQDVLGSLVREPRYRKRYLCGPRLEAQLTGREESAVEGCWPGWQSTEHGVEALLRFLRTHCAKLALPDMGSHLQAFFHKLKRKKYEPMATWSTRYRTEDTKVRRASARLQRTESPDDTEVIHPYFSPQEDQLTELVREKLRRSDGMVRTI